MFIYTNPNPAHKTVGDCVIRGIAILLDKSWDEIYDDITDYGRMMKDMPSSNNVWSQYLFDQGYNRYSIPDMCPDNCYAIWQFCIDHPKGEYLLATGQHVVAVIDGDYYDIWDSGNEVPIYYFKKERR